MVNAMTILQNTTSAPIIVRAKSGSYTVPPSKFQDGSKVLGSIEVPDDFIAAIDQDSVIGALVSNGSLILAEPTQVPSESTQVVKSKPKQKV